MQAAKTGSAAPAVTNCLRSNISCTCPLVAPSWSAQQDESVGLAEPPANKLMPCVVRDLNPDQRHIRVFVHVIVRKLVAGSTNVTLGRQVLTKNCLGRLLTQSRHLFPASKRFKPRVSDV